MHPVGFACRVLVRYVRESWPIWYHRTVCCCTIVQCRLDSQDTCVVGVEVVEEGGGCQSD